MIVIPTFWSHPPVNFGDAFVPDLLASYGIAAKSVSEKRAKLVSLGSILQVLPETYDGYILGSGLIEKSPCKLPDANIWLLRGRLTEEILQPKKKFTLGDPGLLMPLVYTKSAELSYTLGIVPHMVDKDTEAVRRLSKHPEVQIIDVTQPPAETFFKISKCYAILSSSLHGLVAADSLRIPNRHLWLSDNLIGRNFKFKDYYSAFEKPPTINPLTLDGTESLSTILKQIPATSTEIPDKIQNLDRLFKKFSHHLYTIEILETYEEMLRLQQTPENK